jgi:uncharacterized protein YuzE
MILKYDKVADAVYIKFTDMPYAYGKDLDDLRRIDYDVNGNPRGVELLCVSMGVNTDDLPNKGEIERALGDRGIKVFA